MSMKDKESNLTTTIQTENTIKTAVIEELDKLGNGTPWMWKLFFICAIPNILSGFHVSSYVFIGQKPASYWCLVPDLVESGWSPEQIKNVTSRNLEDNGSSCNILNVDYNKLSTMTYDEALNYTSNQLNLEIISCSDRAENYFHYEQEPDVSIVPEWNLICEKNALRSTVQVAISIGKLIGGLIGGIADKFGRKNGFIFGSICYIIGSLLATIAPWYWLFIIARILIGAATSCLFFPSYTLLSENVAPKYRSWLCLGHSISYPIGMLFLSLSAYYIHPWRYLQLVLSIPAGFLVISCYLMFESPRWLLSKGREIEAYRIVFQKEPDTNLIAKSQKIIVEKKKSSSSISDKIKEMFNEYISLYGPVKIRKRALICHFNWYVAAMSYYITAINSDNFSANKYLYVAVTGCVDAPGYIVSMIIVRYTGRKTAACFLYFIAGLAFLIVLVIPKENVTLLVFLAMFGRFGISAAYAVTTLHTSEMFPTEIRNTALGASSTIAHVAGMSAPYIVDLLGLIAWYIPTTICGVSVLIAGFLTTFQPETKDTILKDIIEEETEDTIVKQ